jgi:hypothetical protein
MMAGGTGLDPNAFAFLSAAGITDATITTAIDTLVIQLKAIGVWAKMTAIYPFVGGTASTHKFNLKDPQDANAAFRLVFTGGWVHSATGAKPNGTNAWADTFLIPNTAMPSSGDHLAYYSRTNSATNVDYVIGSENSTIIGSLTSLGLVGKRNATLGANGRGFYTTSNPSLTHLNALQDNPSRDARGFFMGIGSALNTYYILNNNILASNSSLQIRLSRLLESLAIGGFKVNGLVGSYTDKECAFASIGSDLSLAEAANYYTAVQSFQTTLNRQV